MAQDLRSYLDLLKREKPDDALVITKPVDPAYEITALVVKLEREAKRRPVLLFENVKGTTFPVLTNLHASRSRLAAAMRVSALEEMQRTYLKAMERPMPPKIVSGGPVKEVRATGDGVNLFDLPQIIHHEGDAGSYLTAAISFAKHPTAEIWNCAY
ncbi:MAG: UbiD family decarboxylase domain-containing protein, partial [Candidatus Methylomirabilia bacterium]